MAYMHNFFGDLNIQPQTIFIKIEYIDLFYNKYYNYIKPNNKFIIITGGGDQTMPNQIDIRYSKNLKIFENRKKIIYELLKDERLIKWVAENCDELLPKMYGIPTGVFENKELNNFYNQQFSNIINFHNNINVICCHKTRDWTLNRINVNNLCKYKWSSFVTFKENKVLLVLQRNYLLLCVNGGVSSQKHLKQYC